MVLCQNSKEAIIPQSFLRSPVKCSRFDSVAVCFFNFIQIQNLSQTVENVCIKSLLEQETAKLDTALSAGDALACSMG